MGLRVLRNVSAYVAMAMVPGLVIVCCGGATDQQQPFDDPLDPAFVRGFCYPLAEDSCPEGGGCVDYERVGGGMRCVVSADPCEPLHHLCIAGCTWTAGGPPKVVECGQDAAAFADAREQ
jgi:hypothetical protein